MPRQYYFHRVHIELEDDATAVIEENGKEFEDGRKHSQENTDPSQQRIVTMPTHKEKIQKVIEPPPVQGEKKNY